MKVDPACNLELLRSKVPACHKNFAEGAPASKIPMSELDFPTDMMKSVFRIVPFISAKYDAHAKVEMAMQKGLSSEKIKKMQHQVVHRAPPPGCISRI